MAAASQLTTLLNNMYTLGLLDEQFQRLLQFQDVGATDFISEVVTTFCQDGERIVDELARLVERPSVDFDRVDAFLHQLKGSSSSVGAQKVKNGCIKLEEFCQQRSRDGCLMKLEVVRTEFYVLHGNFQTMLQLRRQIRGF